MADPPWPADPGRYHPAAVAKPTDDRFEWLILAAVVAAAAAAVPAEAARWTFDDLPWLHQTWLDLHVGWRDFEAIFELAFGLLLVLPHPVRAGLVLPDLSRAKWRTAAVVLACLGVTVAFNRRLDMPQLRGTGTGYWVWLLGPPAEDLVFAGFLFGKFGQLWPGPIARWLPVDRAVVIAAVYFSLYHALNLRTMGPTFVEQQMAYALAGGLALNLTRQWTGSIAFVVLTHAAASWIAWHGYGL